jgi:hypothetical protein
MGRSKKMVMQDTIVTPEKSSRHHEFWKEFVFKEVTESEKDKILNAMDSLELEKMGAFVQCIMNTSLAIIVSQQKVLNQDLSGEDEERKTREIVIQNLCSFSTFIRYLENHLWEIRKESDIRFIKAVTTWLSRQVQLVLSAIKSMSDFLDIAEITLQTSSIVNGPGAIITLVFRS